MWQRRRKGHQESPANESKDLFHKAGLACSVNPASNAFKNKQTMKPERVDVQSPVVCSLIPSLKGKNEDEIKIFHAKHYLH